MSTKNNLLPAFDLIRDEMARLETELDTVARVEYPLLDNILHQLFLGGGKRLRPALVFLAGQFYNYNVKQLLWVATAVEVLHTATLVHDDLIDNSLMRRGNPTVNSIWHGGIVVLVGDYLFARAAELASQTDNIAAGKLFANTLATICDGQLREFFTARTWQQDQATYYRKIYSKTASLFATSTEMGAIISEAPPAARQALRDYGEAFGMAFQIVDDILDFIGTEEELGKPVGNDLRQGTLTLPAIYYLQMHPSNSGSDQTNPVQRAFETEHNREAHVNAAIQAIRSSPEVIEACYRDAQGFVEKAHQALLRLPDKPASPALHDLADYIVRRRH